MATNHVQKKKTDKLSFINATRCRHNHKTRYELNVRTTYLRTLLTAKHTYTCKQIYFLLAKLYFPKGHLHIMFFYLFSHSVLCILNCLLFNVRCVLFHFFYAIVKFCIVFGVEIVLRAIPVKYGCVSTEITKYTPPLQK